MAVFFTSLFFFYHSDRILHRKVKIRNLDRNKTALMGYAMLFMAIAIPCFLSALRSASVGTDVKVYVEPNFTYASGLIGKGFMYYYENMPKETEIAFSFLLYLGNLCGSMGLSFFLIQFLMICPIYLALRNYDGYVSVTLGMATYYFLFYNISLCLMRGGIAMSFLLLGFYYFQMKRYKVALVIFGVACLFHNSAILMTPVFCMLLLIIGSKYRRIFGVIFSLCILSLFLFANKLLTLMMLVAGSVSSRYAWYLSEYIGATDAGNVPTTDIICKTILLCGTTGVFGYTNKLKSQYKIFLLYSLMGRIFMLFNGVFYESTRIALYFDLFLVLYAASTFCCYKSNMSNKYAVAALTVLPSFLYWIYFIMYIGGGQTNIYTFK